MATPRFFPLVLFCLVLAPLSAQTLLRTEFQDTQPKFIAGDDGSFSGLCLEIMALIEKNSDFQVSYPKIFVPVSRITEDLKAGRIDVYFGLAKTAQREKDFAFVGELFRTRYELLARKGDSVLSFTSLDQLKASGIPILVIRGTAQANYYQTTLGLPTAEAPSAVEVALRQLKAGNGRLFGYYDLGNSWFLESLAYRDALAAVPIVLDEDSQWLCVSPSLSPEVRVRLAQALDTVKESPEWSALMKKYFPRQ